MIHGLATIEAYFGTPTAQADLVAQWISLTPGWAGKHYRLSRGRPLIYLESHLDETGYQDILDDGYDLELRHLRAELPDDAIIRWDHEMDGPRNEWRTWGQMDPSLYVRVFRYVAGILGPLHWCPTSVASRWEPFWPGDDVVSHVGWDQYDNGPRTPLPKAYAPRIRRMRKLTQKPILLGEIGSRALPDVCGRPEWLGTLADVEDVWGTCYFDVKHEDDDWRMSDEMTAVWDGLA